MKKLINIDVIITIDDKNTLYCNESCQAFHSITVDPTFCVYFGKLLDLDMKNGIARGTLRCRDCLIAKETTTC
jgi:hypothetical protein